MDGRLAVVLVHGFGGGERDYKSIKKFLNGQEYPVDFYSFYYKKRFGQTSLIEIGDELALYIQSNLQVRKFKVVAFSQGGLIFRAFAMRHPELAHYVDTIVTVCTPHHGSWFAYLAFGKGVTDLRPGSSLLKKLDKYDDDITYHTVYNPFDPLVIPGTSARFGRAVINKRVLAPSHFLTFGSRKTNEFIESILFSAKSK